MIDATRDEALVNKTSTKAQTLIETMATNSQQFGNRTDPYGKINKVSTNSHIE